MGQNSQIGKIAELVNSCQIETLKKIKNTLKNSFSFKKIFLTVDNRYVCVMSVCLISLGTEVHQKRLLSGAYLTNYTRVGSAWKSLFRWITVPREY